MDLAQLTGRGPAFPVVPDPRLDLRSGGDLVASAIRDILLTQPGERIGHDSYGAGLRRFLFASNNLATRTLVREAVQTAIERDEPRIDLEAVEVRTDSLDDTLLLIDIRYRLLDEPDPRSFVFPLYLEQEAST